MSRPEPRLVTFEIDGREVSAPEGTLLVDAAKLGDVEIPYFCYEPKLGPPVGACRMCLVEIEGLPKLQTSCSTPIKDGMVVTTTSDQVKQAQESVVEFLLVNHPLDCPVCDRGGECPLQDIAFGWGPGRSRFIEPKRHFRKPLELSPLVAIDRERCILCYRCVRFSQEVSEDDQLAFLDRADHTFVGTHDGHPYVAPFSGNIIELCPVGALTSIPYRFRARPWEIEGGGTVCTLCPSQCNVELTVRDDDKVLRVLSRGEGRGNPEVDGGWLCDRGRFGYQAVHAPERVTEPLVREGGALRPVSWERALERAAGALGAAGERAAALVGGETTNEEGFLVQRLVRGALGSPHVDSRAGGALEPELARVLARPDLAARVSDIDGAAAVLVVGTEPVDEMPILDLRVRRAVRHGGARLVVATSRPSTLDGGARAVLRFAPGAEEAALCALVAALEWPQAPVAGVEELARRAGAEANAVREAAEALRSAGGPAVVLWGERLSEGERGGRALRALLALAEALEVRESEGAGLIEVPRGTNSRGLREVGCLPSLGPGLEDAAPAGASAPEIAAALAGGDLSALLLVHADPLRTHPDRGAWERALAAATAVVAIADFVDGGLRDYADVVLPAEAYPEKEGTIVHPDGRLQRLRPAVSRPNDVRPLVWALQELEARVGGADGAAEPAAPAALLADVARAVPFYAGLTPDEIGGAGVRWQDREAAARLPAAEPPEDELEPPPEPPPALGDGGALLMGAHPSLWAGRETEHAPVLGFLAPEQRAELSAADARRLGIEPGAAVEVSANGASIRATAAVRDAVPPGRVFLIEGTREHNATALTNGKPVLVEVRPA